MPLCCFSLIISETFLLTDRYRYQFVGELMTHVLSKKECNVRPYGFPRESKNATSISIAFRVEILIGNENIISEECKTRNLLK